MATEKEEALKRVHEMLHAAHDEVENIRRSLHIDHLSPDSAFAIGHALGVIERAKALVGRDIDDARRS